MKRSGSSRPSKPRNARVLWDEANLEYLDTHRTPKQKITEPKTPYHAPQNEDGVISPIPGQDRSVLNQAVQAQQICDALEAASTSSSKSRSRGGWTSSEDEGEEMDQDSEGNQSVTFNEHRKAHYDEYHKLKALREQPVDDEDVQVVVEARLRNTETGSSNNVDSVGGSGINSGVIDHSR